MSKVKVTANEAGAVIIVSQNNPEWGHIRVMQERVIFDEGWAKKKTISAFIPGTIEDLKALNWLPNQELDGKIIEKESMKPFNTKDPERDYKIAGKTGIVCVVDGAPIYRKTQYTNNPSAADIKILHTNGEDIKEAYLKLKKEALVKEEQEENFSL